MDLWEMDIKKLVPRRNKGKKKINQVNHYFQRGTEEV